MKARLRDQLILVARRRTLVSYREVAQLAGCPLDTPEQRSAFSTLLRQISTEEHARGHPLLSAVVVFQRSLHPGKGFVDLAEALGQMVEQEPDGFFNAELNRVYEFWA